jgi:hypothetical protein
LRHNGGYTLTVAPEPGSPAIGAGSPAVCLASAPAGLGGLDQRGYSRFPNGEQDCTIGAFEFYNLLVTENFRYFGNEPVGDETGPKIIHVTNKQATSVAVSNTLSGSDPSDFIESDNCGGTLGPSQSCTISVSFKPTASGKRDAVLTVADTPDPTSPFAVTLSGHGK